MHESSNDISYELQQLSGWLYDGRGGYSLGYLLRKLPTRSVYTLYVANIDGSWSIDGMGKTIADATPENAAAKLCIELFKKGILTKADNGGEAK